MTLSHVLLGLLELCPRHGYDLGREYAARFGRRAPVKTGRLYATLGRLAGDGLVAAAGVERGGGPDRVSYVVTPAGVDDLERWMYGPEPEQFMQSVVHPKLVLALLSGRSGEGVLDAQRAAHRIRMRELTALKAGADEAERVALDFSLFHLEADLRWLDHTEARLDLLRAELS